MNAVQAFRLLSLRGMLRLEKAGMKTRNGALRPQIAKEFGLSPRAKHDAFIDAINVILAQHIEST
jgi:hypothetical protein